MKTSRTFFSEVERRFDAMPFTLRYERTLHVAADIHSPPPTVLNSLTASRILIYLLYTTIHFPSGRSRTRPKPVWVWWSVPNMSCYSPSVCYMRKRVSVYLFLISCFLFFSTAFTFHLPPPPPSVSLFSGELVAQFKFTVLLMANGPHRITNGPFDPELYKSEHEVQDPELKVRL